MIIRKYYYFINWIYFNFFSNCFCIVFKIFNIIFLYFINKICLYLRGFFLEKRKFKSFEWDFKDFFFFFEICSFLYLILYNILYILFIWCLLVVCNKYLYCCLFVVEFVNRLMKLNIFKIVLFIFYFCFWYIK